MQHLQQFLMAIICGNTNCTSMEQSNTRINPVATIIACFQQTYAQGKINICR